MKAIWDKYRDEEKHGDYADFAAWEEWIATTGAGDILSELDILDKIMVYGAFVDAVNAMECVADSDIAEEARRRA